jgi:DNA-binding XRE family transcriptional regulator
MEDALVLHNKLKEARSEKSLSHAALRMVGVFRNTISSLKRQFNPTAKIA